MSEEKLNIEKAFKLRHEIKSLGRGDPLRGILENILYGRYDGYENAQSVAEEDLEFLTAEREKCHQQKNQQEIKS